MSLACFDTMILIWGIQEHGPEAEVAQAKAFLDHLDKQGTKAVVPSVVVAEFLTGIPTAAHTTIASLLERHFMTAAFDLKASMHFARLWQDRENTGVITLLKQRDRATRAELKADCMIVATAVAQGASCIYSHDDKLKTFANGQIDVRKMPDVATQLELFEA
jgi:predicted nucleic acid-binding protein